MANKLLKGLALAAGTGVALGFGASLGRQRKAVSGGTPAPNRTTDLETRVALQGKEIAELRAQIDESGRRSANEFTAFERSLAKARTDLSGTIEAVITPRVEELRARFQSEMQEANESAFARINQAIDDKLTSRIAVLETALTDHSSAIGSLSQRALETDSNLQKLILSVERLCDRAGALSTPEVPEAPSLIDPPFKSEFKARLQSEPVASKQMFASIE